MIKTKEKTAKWNPLNNITDYKNFITTALKKHMEDTEILNNSITEVIQRAQETYCTKD